MIGRLNHVAIAVSDLEAAMIIYDSCLGAILSQPQILAEHGVKVVFVELPNTKIELMEPFGKDSPIAKFLKHNPSGGIHHVCYEVQDLQAACDHLIKNGMRLAGGGRIKNGAHGRPVIFLHPKDFCGTLIELEQVQ